MVLAIGILVDDAIVVIENVERIMREEGLPPLEATRKAMDQISGAIIGITLVLVAVFVPMAFFPGSTGGIYRQFSVTLAISILFSALMALTLTPALCAAFLKPIEKEKVESEENPLAEDEDKGGAKGVFARIVGFFTGLFARFNRWFGRMTERYSRTNSKILSNPLRGLAVFVLLGALAIFLFLRLPTAFLPTEDQGFLITAVQGPPGGTRNRLEEAIAPVQKYWLDQPEVQNLVVVRGFSFFGQGQNNALMFASMKPWEERTDEGSDAGSMLGKAMGVFSQIEGASVFVIQPPAIQSLGNASGFSMKLEDRTGGGPRCAAAGHGTASRPRLAKRRHRQFAARGSARRAAAQGRYRPHAGDRARLSISDVNAALAINFGSSYGK